MRKTRIKLIASAFLLQAAFPGLNGYAQEAKARYTAMAPLGQYLMPESAEIALAHSAAPASISGDADVMVLRRDGYATAVKGKSGFVCIVERAWGKATDDSEFWNQKMRAPHCFNPQAARTFFADLPDEDQTGATRKIESGDPCGYHVGDGQEGAAAA